MRVLVCGGRDYGDAERVQEVLDALDRETRISYLIEGEAPGADTLARQWADARWIPVLKFPADWEKHGKAAGSIRNRQMLDEGRPDLVVAFPGGRGTANMVDQAERAGVPVRRVATA